MCVDFTILSHRHIYFLTEQFRDNLGSYDGMFYLTGAISIISGSLWLLAPIAAKFECAKKPKNAKQYETIEGINGSNKNIRKEAIIESAKAVN